MTRASVLASALTLVFIVPGCGTGTTPVGTSGSGNGSSTSSGGVIEDPLPCELEAMVDERCWQCHGEEPKFGALRSLVSRDNLMGSGDGHDSLAEACVTRMSLPSDDEERMPLPPRPVASSDEVALMQSYVDAGFPMRAEGETCE